MKRLALHQMTIAAPKVTRNPMKMKSLTLIALKQTCRKRQKSIRSIQTRQCKCGEDEQACNWGITISDVLKKLNNCLELSSTELDFVTLGGIQRSVNCSDVSASSRTEKNCKLLRMSFFFHGKKICRKTFLFLHFIRKSEFCSLVKHGTMVCRSAYMATKRDLAVREASNCSFRNCWKSSEICNEHC